MFEKFTKVYVGEDDYNTDTSKREGVRGDDPMLRRVAVGLSAGLE